MNRPMEDFLLLSKLVQAVRLFDLAWHNQNLAQLLEQGQALALLQREADFVAIPEDAIVARVRAAQKAQDCDLVVVAIG